MENTPDANTGPISGVGSDDAVLDPRPVSGCQVMGRAQIGRTLGAWRRPRGARIDLGGADNAVIVIEDHSVVPGLFVLSASSSDVARFLRVNHQLMHESILGPTRVRDHQCLCWL